MSCDTEACESCGAQTVEGNDQHGRCRTCSGDTSLGHMLRLMAAGVTRDRTSGRFVSIKGA